MIFAKGKAIKRCADNKFKMADKRLILFDIDHTLMDIGDSHRKAFMAGFKKVLGLEVDYSTGWKFHGFTDLQIIHEVMDEYKIKKDPGKIAKIMEVMIDDFKKQNLSHALLMPGIPHILKELQKNKEIIIGLVTGNLKEIAYTKLRHFNIEEYFILGGFGDISTIRADLVKYAIKKAEELHGKIKKSNVIIVGDTIHDIRCAKESCVKCLAVATGTYSYGQLNEKNPDYIFEDLKDSKKIIEVIKNG